jgi:hypothetical protein
LSSQRMSVVGLLGNALLRALPSEPGAGAVGLVHCWHFARAVRGQSGQSEPLNLQPGPSASLRSGGAGSSPAGGA